MYWTSKIVSILSVHKASLALMFDRRANFFPVLAVFLLLFYCFLWIHVQQVRSNKALRRPSSHYLAPNRSVCRTNGSSFSCQEHAPKLPSGTAFAWVCCMDNRFNVRSGTGDVQDSKDWDKQVGEKEGGGEGVKVVRELGWMWTNG